MKTLASRHEEEIAEWSGDDRTIGSGNKHDKLDVVSRSDSGVPWWLFIQSLKCTQGKGITITEKLWKEAEDAAFNRGPQYRPALGIRIYGESKARISDVPVKVDLVAISVNDWLELRRQLNETKT